MTRCFWNWRFSGRGSIFSANGWKHRARCPPPPGMRKQWDVVIADYVLPHFDGLAALAMRQRARAGFASGHRVRPYHRRYCRSRMKAGAHDYVMMKANLARLGSGHRPGVCAKPKSAARNEPRRRSFWEEQAFRNALEKLHSLGHRRRGSPRQPPTSTAAFCRMVGWDGRRIDRKKPPFDYWPPEQVENTRPRLSPKSDRKSVVLPGGLELRLRRKDGQQFDALLLVTALKDTFDNTTGVVKPPITDITQRQNRRRMLCGGRIENWSGRVRERTADLSAANVQLQGRAGRTPAGSNMNCWKSPTKSADRIRPGFA